jgi:hypothetical protein
MDEQLSEWLQQLCAALDLPPEFADHEQLLLDVARDAAHHVMRPAAPLTTFLVGVAAGRSSAVNAGDIGSAVEQAATVASALAVEWPNPSAS